MTVIASCPFSVPWAAQFSLVSFLHCLVIVGDTELSFSFPTPLETQPSFLTGDQVLADRKSFCVHIHTAVSQQGRLPMVFSSCKEFVFPAWQRCATQVACNIVGSTLIEASLCGGASGVFGVPTDICDS